MAEERVQRRLAAILAADVVGYSHMMSLDETGTLSRLKKLRRDVFDPKTKQYGGRIFKTTGDGAFVEFNSAVEAVKSAADIQEALAALNVEASEDQKISLRIGISLGDVIVEGSDLYGNGVNIASRMEGLAEPGGICVSGNVHEHIGTSLDVNFEDLGEQSVKNIDQPVRCYRVHMELSGAAGPFAQQPDGAATLPDMPSIAVLPFNNMSTDPEQEHFSDGICEDIITELSKLSELMVIARNSSFTYKGKSVKVQQVGHELGVRYVLEGSVRKSGNQVRITAQLIDTVTDHHLWSERYDRELDDIFILQSEVAHEIATALEVALVVEKRDDVRSVTTPDREVYELYKRAGGVWSPPVKDNALRARHMCEEVLQRDPEFAGGYAGVAYTYCLGVGHGFSESPELDLEKATELAEKAIAVDNKFGPSNTVFAYTHFLRHHYDQAIWFAERAVRIQPGDAFSRGWLGYLLIWSDRMEQCREELDHAIRLDPLHPTYWAWRGFLAFGLGDYEDTISMITDSINKFGYRDYHFTLAFKTAAYSELGMETTARETAEQLLNMYPDFTVSTWGRKLFHYKLPEDFQRLTDPLVDAGIPK